MDKIKKFLRKLTHAEQLEIFDLIERIVLDDLTNLNIKRLQGHRDLYRLRRGDFRIIFMRMPTGNRIIEVTRRSDTTYRDY